MERVSEKGDYYHTFKIIFILTIIQFWWIAIWGIAYIVIDVFAGPSKAYELLIYFFMMFFTIAILHMYPNLLDKL